MGDQNLPCDERATCLKELKTMTVLRAGVAGAQVPLEARYAERLGELVGFRIGPL